jgi:hypothetical protein
MENIVGAQKAGIELMHIPGSGFAAWSSLALLERPGLQRGYASCTTFPTGAR